MAANWPSGLPGASGRRCVASRPLLAVILRPRHAHPHMLRYACGDARQQGSRHQGDPGLAHRGLRGLAPNRFKDFWRDRCKDRGVALVPAVAFFRFGRHQGIRAAPQLRRAVRSIDAPEIFYMVGLRGLSTETLDVGCCRARYPDVDRSLNLPRRRRDRHQRYLSTSHRQKCLHPPPMRQPISPAS
jgi:hypothetical protein